MERHDNEAGILIGQVILVLVTDIFQNRPMCILRIILNTELIEEFEKVIFFIGLDSQRTNVIDLYI